MDKQLAKIVTSDAIYKDMGITSLVIKKTKEIGYSREISLTAQKVTKTKRKTVKIPSYVLKSGETKANAGTASVSNSSSRSGGSSGSSGNSGSSSSSTASSSSSPGKAAGKPSGGSSSGTSSAKKNQSILYGVASGMGWI